MTINEKLKTFENNIKYKFENKKLLRTCLTHKSYAYEIRNTNIDSYNERLEYLGDAILEHVISDVLYKHVPLLNEGSMTKKRAEIVCEKSLSDAFKSLNGEDYIFLGKCELATSGNKKNAILADAFEALIGAIYLDSNFEVARNFILEVLDIKIQDTLDGNIQITDYKTVLQELLQKNGTVKIEYKVINEMGPDHDKRFEVEVIFNDKVIGIGEGKNRKKAEQKAAEVAYEKFKT